MRQLFPLLALAVLGLAARASDFIPPPPVGVSASVAQPHVVAQLISETTHVAPGQSFLVALHLHMDKDWHTYWSNPGDAGLATQIDWTLPPGFTAGPLQFPTPEIHMMGPLTTYGYAGDVYLLTTITPPKTIAVSDTITNGIGKGRFEIKAHATWLVCQEECIPGHANLFLKLDDHATLQLEPGEFFSAAARARLPALNTRWSVKGTYGPDALSLKFTDLTGASPQVGGHLYFFPSTGNVLDPKEDPAGIKQGDPGGGFTWPLKLQQNGEKPDHLGGVLVSDQPLLPDGKTKAISIASFPVGGAAPASAPAAPAPAAPAAPAPTSAPAASALATPPPFLIAVLGAAFLGGLILNLMPCVLPVLSLKVFSLMKHAGDDPRGAWKQGAAFTAGVVISFWVLAGLLLALRAAGNQLGWGFQMQSPGFVAALILIFFLLGLNLFGVFELGASLVGLDAKATGRVGHGLASSFLNGALATLAATPCTAPFMGSSLGFAAQQPPFVALLIFTFLALGMATPYLLLTIFPGALRFVPRPGAWMEAVKQFMGFLLLATVIFLLYVFGALVGQDQVPDMLGVLLITGVAAWIYGRWGGALHSAVVRAVSLILVLLLLAYAIHWSIALAGAKPPEMSGAGSTAPDGWQPWTPAAVNQALAQNRPVFVDFTAAWCLSCKVNERVALDTDTVRAAFAQKNVALFRADWTHADPAITATLRKYQRDGVPLYLLYSPKAKDTPQVLPEVLTPGIVLDALRSI